MILVLLILGAFSPLANAESAPRKSQNQTQKEDLSFLNEYDKKIKELDNYRVTFVEPSTPYNRTRVQIASRPTTRSNFKVVLVNVRKKS
jgi:hypothetical protein